MKKIIIIDGGPRRNMNTAGMLQAFAEGARSAGKDVEVKVVRLYDLDYKGCMSCMACKIKGRASNICKFKDALTPVLEDIAQADGLVLGSPIYFGDVTGQMRTFLERLAFPWLSYNDYSLTAPKRMPVVLIETMNGLPERNNSNGYGSMEHCLTAALGKPERIIAYNTYQVKNYDRVELAAFSEDAKEQEAEQKTVVKLSGILFIAAFVVAGLNWRFGWWVLPDWAVWAAAGVFLVSYLLYAEVLRENTYLSRTIEVQENQKVIDTGLYGIVRHPMYMATTILFLAMPLVLASPISFIIMLGYIPVIAKRIKNEEKVLEEGLEGYREYKQKVKYKVIPFVW